MSSYTRAVSVAHKSGIVVNEWVSILLTAHQHIS